MKVSELINKLESMPQDADVFIDGREWETPGEVYLTGKEVFLSYEK